MDAHPVADLQRNVVSFDGRLDNCEEVAELLGLSASRVTDSQLILSAFERWGEACFSRFVGDWALALWSSAGRTLYLARDHAGARTLYLREDNGTFLWSTYLDTFLACASQLRMSHDYAASYLTGLPVRELTPYEGVRSILPGHYSKISNGIVSQHSHWSSLVVSSVRHKGDAEYEQHFLELFKKAVERRTGPGAPILGQLSGGMDSTSVVCMSDYLRRSVDPDAEIVDTVSFYDDSEASFNDSQYFPIVESKRGKVGTHIDIAFSQRTFEPHDIAGGLYLLPGADSFSLVQERRFCNAVWQRGYRSILSGIGGDEVLGGVPVGFPELAGHLLSGEIRKFVSQSLAWSLLDREPLIATLYDTAKYAVHLYTGPRNYQMAPPWVARSLRERSCEMERRRSASHLLAGVAPHRIDNHLAWWSIMETMPHLFPGILYRPEYRYPFLDKDLVNYLFSIPREQLLRPGQRRSLMRRALRNIVPDEILSRRRKAFQLSGPLRVLEQSQPALEQLFSDAWVGLAGFVDMRELHAALKRTVAGDPKWWQMILRTIALELWLRASQDKEWQLFSTRVPNPVDLSLTA
jgi:asparagine synthase (glutamine-hydrolysing)